MKSTALRRTCVAVPVGEGRRGVAGADVVVVVDVDVGVGVGVGVALLVVRAARGVGEVVRGA